MERVAEVVGYVLSEGLYCILNVHHDTGSANTAWLRASSRGFNEAEDTFRALWQEIATRFRDADQHLIFEAYNEMLDDYSSWCYASFSAPGSYSSTSAEDTYSAIPSSPIIEKDVQSRLYYPFNPYNPCSEKNQCSNYDHYHHRATAL